MLISRSAFVSPKRMNSCSIAKSIWRRKRRKNRSVSPKYCFISIHAFSSDLLLLADSQPTLAGVSGVFTFCVGWGCAVFVHWRSSEFLHPSHGETAADRCANERRMLVFAEKSFTWKRRLLVSQSRTWRINPWWSFGSELLMMKMILMGVDYKFGNRRLGSVCWKGKRMSLLRFKKSHPVFEARVVALQSYSKQEESRSFGDWFEGTFTVLFG